jgi:hypothetical protein
VIIWFPDNWARAVLMTYGQGSQGRDHRRQVRIPAVTDASGSPCRPQARTEARGEMCWRGGWGDKRCQRYRCMSRVW